ncbi:GH1 family beta-glucosidase [Sapientia aquatica]|uniref:Beta-glucosidase n=1 Tax=Sapientia aquatica TaxID=1549640 RepID=A0A4R5W293_9BURK|nr:GH1 family beta-glucosidase [Sapientia aquatica]TDK66452.1 beta-glucosidase [Sapientia aquatica]
MPNHSLPNSSVSLAKDHFPSDFVWGVATSAFQIEGAAKLDGKGPSIWDEFCQIPKAISDGSNGDVACDHYHLLETDLDLIEQLNVDAYRFSISWPRVRPTGAGQWNEAGLAFYDRLFDGLLKRGIKPYVTLNHWDLPAALQHQGGWANRETVERFVEYAQLIHARFGDRIASLVTHNEPWVMATLGNELGIFAPGMKDRAIAAQASHHLLLSHGLAVRALRAAGAAYPLGIALNLSPMHAVTASAEDHAKARLEDGKLLRWYMDPLFKKSYPADVWSHLGADAPTVLQGDLDLIAAPIDFLGINYYSRTIISAEQPWDAKSNGKPVTDMGWEIYPAGLTELLVRIHQDYQVPTMFVTENGAAFKDQLINNRIHDLERTDYLKQHLLAIHAAMQQGVNMGGYLVWSLLDNFEWACGYEKRFGIVHVDYQTQRRTLKDSALWYQDFLRHSSKEHS